ncbi:hypothetical protein MuYL_2824 [Mucilaginibacter xinganensis]|uniref:Uncharacterized protein n=1 Tax=Mucilaginibacter xinganensis TaxID=1234841 RepID=A0A223NYS1_9SPHI|nr:hypothetical protein MuYL_2824 [Mucilaginibacter xinganensis]
MAYSYGIKSKFNNNWLCNKMVRIIDSKQVINNEQEIILSKI